MNECERESYASWCSRIVREATTTCSLTLTDLSAMIDQWLADPGGYPCQDHDGACASYSPWTPPSWRGPDYADPFDPFGIVPNAYIGCPDGRPQWVTLGTGADCKES